MDPANNERSVLSAAVLNGLARQQAKCRADLVRADEKLTKSKATADEALNTANFSIGLINAEDKSRLTSVARTSIQNTLKALQEYEIAAVAQSSATKDHSNATHTLKQLQKEEETIKGWETRGNAVFQQLMECTMPSVMLFADDDMDKLIDQETPMKAADDTKAGAKLITDALAVFTPVRLMAAFLYHHDKQNLQVDDDHEQQITSPYADGTRQQFVKAIVNSANKSLHSTEDSIQEDIKTRMYICRLVDSRVDTPLVLGGGAQNAIHPSPFGHATDQSEVEPSPRDRQGRGRKKNARLNTAITDSRDELFVLQPSLRNLARFVSVSKFREMYNQGAALGKLFEGYEHNGCLCLPIYDFLVSIEHGTANNVSKVPVFYWTILRKCLARSPALKRFIDDTRMFTDPNAFLSDPSRTQMLEDIRSISYIPGQRGIWSFGIDSTYSVDPHVLSYGVHSLKITVGQTIQLAKRLEHVNMHMANIDLLPREWVYLMKYICGKIARHLDVLGQDRLLRFKWLKTVSSAEDLPLAMKQENHRAWKTAGQALFAVIMDNTPGQETCALAAFEKGGKVDGSATVHVLQHYDDPRHDWVRLISKLFPDEHSLDSSDLEFHAQIPHVQNDLKESPSRQRLLATGMFMLIDFVYLVITGNQYEGERVPPVNMMLRQILVYMAADIMEARMESRRKAAAREAEPGTDE